MVKTIAKKGLLCLMMFLMVAPLLMGGTVTAAAENPVEGTDGTYTVKAENSMPMGKSAISSDAVVEKEGENYYVSLSFDTMQLRDCTMEIEGKRVGTMVRYQGDFAVYTYTVSAETLKKPLPVSVLVVQMKKTKQVEVTLDLASAVKTSDTVEDRGERPAQFVPVLKTGAGSQYTLEKGTVFTVPSATATLGDTPIREVTLRAYYLQGEEKTDVAVSENRQVILSEIGEYHVIFRAESPLFKTSVGANTYVEYDVTVFSKTGVVTVAKFEDKQGVLPQNSVLQASPITEGEVFEQVKTAVKTVTDRYTVLNVSLYDEGGNPIFATGAITLYLQPDDIFPRTEVVVYHMDEAGVLTKLDAAPYGRYVSVETDKTGTFIVAMPGVAFQMPMWGYALIAGGALLLLAAAIVAVAVLVKKKQKKKQEQGKEENETEDISAAHGA